MSSSDSEDGCYSNVVKNRELIREQCRMKLLANTEVAAVKCTGKTDISIINLEKKESTTSNTARVANNTTSSLIVDSIEDDFIIDEIIAKNSKPVPRSRGRKKKESVIRANATEEPVVGNTGGRGRGRVSRRGRASKTNVIDMGICNNLASAPLSNGRGRKTRSSASTSAIEDLLGALISNRGRGRKRSRVNYSPNSSVEELLQNLSPVNINGRGNTRQQSRGRGVSPLAVASPIYPTYSIGNTDEYPDMSDDVPLFSKPSTKTKHETVDLDQTVTENVDDNESLSVKVIWKSFENFKFTIRKYQNITQIFDFFAQKENVSKDKLLFMYKNKILTREDTPASIDYNIAKFIDGGVVSHSVHNIFKNKTIINGIKIKFQCQNIKKPLEIAIGNDDKLSLAMTQCAETLEVPLNKLKFEFDGDIVAGTSSPQQMGLEDGDCIDVMMLS
ncbi:uncharacterized protein CG4449 [Pararge aegeria]|uniref:uncharacterized protein CG4449 n=1 Tax=Pararge aegeria TaxID=116150 RepID=UPI0019D15F72|nr:uncharacterized protein CG4449 [Pararge aegeria]